MEIIVHLCGPDEISSLTCGIKLYLLALSVSVLQENCHDQAKVPTRMAYLKEFT